MNEADRILEHTAHRPWPLPHIPWIMYQRWESLLFAHWRVPASQLRALVPSSLEVEEYDGTGWVGLTPFCLAELHARGLPPVPGASRFLEMNFRTYVSVEDKPGIFFFSLDAENRLAVAAARVGYRLPYRYARMRMERREEWIRYESRRDDDSNAEFIGEYRPTGAEWSPVAGTLEHFLTERYALYAELGGGILLRGEIHHPPWTIRRAEAQIERNTVAAAHGIRLPDEDPLLHFAAPQPTLIWPPIPVRS